MNIPFEKQNNTSNFNKILPTWAVYNKRDGRIEVNPDEMFSVCLAALGESFNQYWLEVSRRCVTTYILDKLKDFKEPLYIRYIRTSDNISKLDKYPDISKNENDAQRGALEFRAYYSLIKLALDAY